MNFFAKFYWHWYRLLTFWYPDNPKLHSEMEKLILCERILRITHKYANCDAPSFFFLILHTHIHTHLVQPVTQLLIYPFLCCQSAYFVFILWRRVRPVWLSLTLSELQGWAVITTVIWFSAVVILKQPSIHCLWDGRDTVAVFFFCFFHDLTVVRMDVLGPGACCSWWAVQFL